jgi:hypothetical protein
MILRLLAILILQGTDTRPAVQDASTGGLDPKIRQATQKSIERGLALLVKDQNKDGSWGGPRNKTMTDGFANVETHHSWTVATTGLVCMTLLDTNKGLEANGPLDRGIDYLIANADVKRPADWDIDNSWGLIYGLQGISRALAADRYKNSPKRDAMKKAAATMVKGLEEYQTPEGGWAYYASPDAAWRPGGMATSFQTGAAVLALLDAKAAGMEVHEKMFQAAVRAVKHCRLPTGAYTYMLAPLPSAWGISLEGIDQVKGSLSRIQVCNLALYRAGDKSITLDVLRKGLDDFFEYHKFLDVGLHKPIPHEAFYAVAAYFYLFGHHYASQVIEALPQKERESYWGKLRGEIIKTQESDGGMWDFWISGHTKPYGTSFSVMALQRSLGPRG